MGASESQEPETPSSVVASHRHPIDALPDTFNQNEKKIFEDTNKERHVYHDESDEEEVQMSAKV